MLVWIPQGGAAPPPAPVIQPETPRGVDLAVYRLDVYDDAGLFRGSLTGSAAGGIQDSAGFLSLSCIRRVNAPGMMVFSLRGDHPLLTSLSDKWQFELWRKPYSQAWARELVTIFRESQWSYDEKSNIVLTCPGIISLLGMRIINYPADTSNMTKFISVAAETIMKRLVTYNITSSATTGNGRKRDGTNWPATRISVEVDGAHGNILNWYCMGDNLLESLQKLVLVADGDFDLVKTSPTSYEFRWYTDQLGTNRSATVKFALGLGNMGAPQYNESWIEEKTVACIWGKGEGASREYATRTGTNYAAGNDIEVFINASNVEAGNTNGLNDQGDQKLAEMEAERSFKFNALQAPATLYGIHYFLGDLVSAVNPKTGTTYTLKVAAVTQTLEPDGKQGISVELSTP